MKGLENGDLQSRINKMFPIAIPEDIQLWKDKKKL